MDNLEYVKQHQYLEKKSDKDGNELVNYIYPYLLLFIKNAKSDLNVLNKIENLRIALIDIYTDKVNDYLEEYLDDLIDDIEAFESKGFKNKLQDKSKTKSNILNSALVIKTSLIAWLTRMAFKDYYKISRIIRLGEDVDNNIKKYIKNPINNFKRIVDALIFGSTFIIRDEILKANQIKFIRWVSILDGRTSPMCRLRSGKIYYLENKMPYNHNVEWEEPGVYHWGCRSFVIPWEI